MRKLLIFLTVLCLLAAASSAFATEILINGGFEDGTGNQAPPWSYWGGTGGAVANPSQDANNPSPRVWSNFGNPTYVNVAAQNIYDKLWLMPGMTYHVHAQYYIPSSEVQPGITPRAGIYMTFTNGTFVRILDPRVPDNNVPPIPNADIPVTDQWYTFDFDWVCPGNPGDPPLQCSYMSFRWYGTDGNTIPVSNPGGYIDNCSFSAEYYMPTFSGYVKDAATNNGIPNATVTISTSTGVVLKTTTTNSSGYYSVAFDWPYPLPAGMPLKVDATANDYISRGPQSFTVTGTNPAIPNVLMDAPPKISGFCYTTNSEPVAGAKVTVTNGSTFTVTATTGTDGSYSVFTEVGGGVYTVSATYHNKPLDPPSRVVDTTSGSQSNVNFTYSGPVVPRPSDLLFSVDTDVLPDSGPTGPWPTVVPTGGSLTPIQTPEATILGNVKWESNVYTDYDGYRFGTSYWDDQGQHPIPCNGATIVMALKPTRNTTNVGWTSCVDIFYDRLVLGIKNNDGRVNVRRNGSLDFSTTAIPDGQETILSIVVQPDGSYVVWANGAQMMTRDSTPEGFTSMVPGVTGGGINGFGTYINVGRNNPDGWTTFNGYIGDVYVYKVALTNEERTQLESLVAEKFIGPTISGTCYKQTIYGNEPLPGAVVTVTNGSTFTKTATTGPDGTYTVFTEPGGGVYTVSATYDGKPLSPDSYQVDTTTGPQSGIDFALEFRVVNVYLEDSAHNPMDGYVFLASPDKALVEQTSLGVTFFSVPPGEYNLYVDITGYKPQGADPIHVDARTSDQDITVTMIPDSSYTLKLIDLDASGLTEGTPITSWANTGIIGGSFQIWNPSPALPVEVVSGKKSVTLGTNPMKLADSAGNIIPAPPTMSGNDDWSVVYWVYNPVVNNDEWVLAWGHRDTENKCAAVGYGTNGGYGAFGGWGAGDVGFGATPPAGVWHYIVQTYNGSNFRIYVDGELDQDTTRNLNIWQGDPIYLGAQILTAWPDASKPDGPWQDMNTMFSGSLAKLQVYAEALSEAQVKALTPPDYAMRIQDAKKLNDGESVTLYNKPVTIAPSTSTGHTDYFYIEERDRTAGIKVKADPNMLTNAGDGLTVVVSGTMATDPVTNERYINVAAPPIFGGEYWVKPLLVNTKSVQEDPKLVGMLVSVGGTIDSIASDGKSFTIKDGYAKDGSEFKTTVRVEGASKISQFAPGNFIRLEGVVSKKTADESQIIYRDIKTNNWFCGFELDEGYMALRGLLQAGQRWYDAGWSPLLGGSGRTMDDDVSISNERAAGGSQSLKFYHPDVKDNPVWWLDILGVWHPLPVAYQKMDWCTLEFKLYVAPEQPDPLDPNRTLPGCAFNQFYFAANDPNFGIVSDWARNNINTGPDPNWHASVQHPNAPDYADDPGVPLISGAWNTIKVHEDYVNHKRTITVNGVSEIFDLDPAIDRHPDYFMIWYGTGYPYVFTAGISQPFYVDNLSYSWAYSP